MRRFARMDWEEKERLTAEGSDSAGAPKACSSPRQGAEKIGGARGSQGSGARAARLDAGRLYDNIW